ncbi:hypothetical protein MRX96_030757 [Rhipicephalus microplus]
MSAFVHRWRCVFANQRPRYHAAEGGTTAIGRRFKRPARWRRAQCRAPKLYTTAPRLNSVLRYQVVHYARLTRKTVA